MRGCNRALGDCYCKNDGTEVGVRGGRVMGCLAR